MKNFLNIILLLTISLFLLTATSCNKNTESQEQPSVEEVVPEESEQPPRYVEPENVLGKGVAFNPSAYNSVNPEYTPRYQKKIDLENVFITL